MHLNMATTETVPTEAYFEEERAKRKIHVSFLFLKEDLHFNLFGYK
jgi:hypothetical protein